ncbi:MAG: FkbM family methyltransferase [Pirellula sp.]|jgi:FkbM family methyltransferase
MLIVWFRLTDVIRHYITFLNFLVGRGSGSGWKLEGEVSIAASLIKRSAPVVFDVGGNVGAWSELFRQKNSTGELYIFEPQPVCQAEIEKKCIENSHLVGMAVGEAAGKLVLYTSSPTDGSASLHKRGDSFFQHKEYGQQEVSVVSLDDFIAENRIGFVDFIKFDIEGHEFSALMGLRNALAERRIGAFSFEFGSGNLNSRTSFRDFWNLLSADYDLNIVTPSGYLTLLPAYYEDFEFYRGVSNFIAILKSPVENT